jgi:predicted nucleotidyltransferase
MALNPFHDTQRMSANLYPVASSLDAWLSLATARLCAELNPELVLLFGSWARGTASRRSDVDLLVVWQTDERPLDRIGRVLTILIDSPLPVDVIAFTPQELESRRHSHFLRRILSEGRTLYERRAA